LEGAEGQRMPGYLPRGWFTRQNRHPANQGWCEHLHSRCDEQVQRASASGNMWSELLQGSPFPIEGHRRVLNSDHNPLGVLRDVQAAREEEGGYREGDLGYLGESQRCQDNSSLSF
jgi:hypothetical protein